MTIKEKLDLITEDTWIISDTHIGHGNASKGILKFEPKRLEQMKKEGFSEDQHDEWVIKNWNETVKPNEVVLHLGDFAFTKRKDSNEFIEFCELSETISEEKLINILDSCKGKNLLFINKFIRDNIKTE